MANKSGKRIMIVCRGKIIIYALFRFSEFYRVSSYINLGWNNTGLNPDVK